MKWEVFYNKNIGRNREIDRENQVLYDKMKKIMDSHAKDVFLLIKFIE